MLTQGPAPDPKCKLNISSFLTLPHLLDCLICPRKGLISRIPKTSVFGIYSQKIKNQI